jgi:hypothetical protein
MIGLLLLGSTLALILTVLITKVDNFLEDEGNRQWKI